MLDFQPQPVVEAHVEVCHPHQREPRDEIPAPAGIKQLEVEKDESQPGDVMRKAILAGEKIEDLAYRQCLRALALLLAVVTRLGENLLMGDGPRGACDRQRQQQQHPGLMTEW